MHQTDWEKIFGVGFHKTGTSSLAKALRMLGIPTIHGDPRDAEYGGDEGVTLIRYIESGNFNLPTLSHYQAFVDNPYFTIWKQLHEFYPRAKFILTMRDEVSWIRSCVRYYSGRRVRPMRQWMFGEHADPSASDTAREAWLAAYRKHNEAVLAYFGKENPQFLIMNIIAGDGWETLCPFLGMDIPDRKFPHANSGAHLSREQ